MTGFDYSKLNPTSAGTGTNPAPEKPSNPLPDSGLNPFINKINLTTIFGSEKNEPSIPPLVQGNVEQTFVHFAVKTGFAQEQYAWEIATKHRQTPAVLTTLTEILAQRKKQFSSIDAFYSVVAYRQLKPVDTLITVLERMKSVRDEWIFDNVFGVISNNRELHERINADPQRTLEEIIESVTRIKNIRGNQFFGGFHYDEAVVVLDHSKEPAHDLDLVLGSISLSVRPKPSELEAFYLSGHSYIYHTEAFGIPSYQQESKALPSELDLRKRLSLLVHYPPLETHDQLVADLLSLTEGSRAVALDTMNRFYTDQLDFAYFGSFVECLRQVEKLDGVEELARVVPKLRGDQIVIAISILEDIVNEDPHNARKYLNDFQAGNLAVIEQDLYRNRLQRHQAKFPEQPLNATVAAFQRKEFPESELPAPQSLAEARDLYQRIAHAGVELLQDSKPSLTRKMRQLVKDSSRMERGEFKIRFFSLAREIFKREFGVYPYNTQMLAVLLMCDENIVADADRRGVYAQIKTGEGKSLIMCLLAGYHAAQGKTVDVITSNEYLAKRDALRFESFFQLMGLECGSLDKANFGETVKKAPAVLYTTNEALIFSYLNSRLRGIPFFNGTRQQVALVDESDNLCIDRTSEECRIASEMGTRFSEATLHHMMRFVAEVGEAAIRDDIAATVSSFQEADEEVRSTHPLILNLYLRSAVTAQKLVLDEDYVINAKGEVVVVDVENTGRLQHRLFWSHGLHDFVALKHSLKLPPTVGTTASMGHPTYLRMYKELYCISGTIGDQADREEIQAVYGLTGFDVPPHRPSKRVDHPTVIIESQKSWLAALERTANELTRGSNPRPLLIVASSVKESVLIHQYLKERGFAAQLLNDHSNQDENGNPMDENQILARAGRAGGILVATSVAGRGADIIAEQDAVAAGGVHTTITFLPINKRVEYQARGRAGRQGNQGSSEIIACLERDRFFRDLPEFVREAILDTVRDFGPASDEVQRLVEFTRTSVNILFSLNRRLRLDKGDAAQQALELYYKALASTATSLEAKNLTFAHHKSNGLASFVVSLYMQQQWSRSFDEFDTVLTSDGRLIVSHQDESGVSVYESSSTRRILDAFKSCFGLTLQEAGVLPVDHPNAIAAKVAAAYFNQVVLFESRRFTLDSEKLALMLAKLGREVDQLTQDCFAKFGSLSDFEIDRYIKEEMKKRKKEGDTESSSQ